MHGRRSFLALAGAALVAASCLMTASTPAAALAGASALDAEASRLMASGQPFLEVFGIDRRGESRTIAVVPLRDGKPIAGHLVDVPGDIVALRGCTLEPQPGGMALGTRADYGRTSYGGQTVRLDRLLAPPAAPPAFLAG